MKIPFISFLCLNFALLFMPVHAQAATNTIFQSLSFSLNETWASGWVPPATWKSVYTQPVIQSEVILEARTSLDWPKYVYLSLWVQNPLDGDAFRPPAGEVDYALGLGGHLFAGVNFTTEVRFVDVGKGEVAEVGTFGDNDLLRLRQRIERPVKFAKVHTITPALVWYHFEPISHRNNVAGDALSPQLTYDWRPMPWLKLGVGGGAMRDYGINGGIPANILSCWGNIAARIWSDKKDRECWLFGRVHNYGTQGHPSNRPDRSFNIFSAGLSVKL